MKPKTQKELKDPGDRVELTLEVGFSDGRGMSHQEASRFEKVLRRLAPEVYPGVTVRACWVAQAPLFLGHGEPPARLADDAFERVASTMTDTGLADGVAPLTPKETKWLRSLERLLKRMPPRLLLIESGDFLLLVDRNAARDVELYDGKARENGVLLADVQHSGLAVSGVSG